jgi:LEA14-like dessication related protein
MQNPKLFYLLLRSKTVVRSWLALSLMLTLALCSACSLLLKQVLEKPKVALETVDVREVGPAGATVVFNVRVENPNPVGITVDALKYDIEIAGKLLSSGQLEKPAQVPAKEKVLVGIPVSVKYSDVLNSVMSFLSSGLSTYRVKGEAAIGLFSIPFDQKGEFKLRQ